jgi:hypothetical protein
VPSHAQSLFVSAGHATFVGVSEPKMHHYVPQAYLKGFGRDNRVAVRWRHQEKIIVANVRDVAGETGFYETEVGGVPSIETEYYLQRIDDKAFSAIRAIVQAGQVDCALAGTRAALTRFIAVQVTRTPELRERVYFPAKVLKYGAGRSIDEDLVAEYLEQVHLGFRPKRGEVKGALMLVQIATAGSLPSQTDAVELSLSVSRALHEVIYRKHWRLEIASAPAFITSDTPVVIWRTPNPRDHYEGIGVENAEEIRFPLDATHQLVLTNDEDPQSTSRVNDERVTACNADLAAACHRFIVGHPDRQEILQQVSLAARRPTARFNVGPGFERGSDGSDHYIGEIFHMWMQRGDLHP